VREGVGAERLLWGSDITMCTGLAKLRYLTHLLAPADLELVTWKNAGRIFPRGAFPGRLMRIDANAFLGAYPYARVPGTSPAGVLAAMQRTGVDEAW